MRITRTHTIGGLVVIVILLIGIVFGMIRGNKVSAEQLLSRIAVLKAQEEELNNSCDMGIAKRAERTALEEQYKLLTGSGAFQERL